MGDVAGEQRWNRSVTALLLTSFCTSTAALTAVTALGKQVYDLTGRELDLGLLGLAVFAPAALLVFVSGPVADHFDRRRVVSIAAVGEAACGLALLLYAASGRRAVLPLFALVVAFGVGRAFVAPSARSLPADIVPPEELPWLVARSSMTFQSALIAGPVLGGTLYAVDVRLPYAAMTVLLLVAAGTIQLVQVRPRPGAAETGRRASSRPSLHDALEGLRVIRRQSILLGVISLDLFAVLFGGAIALLPAIAEERLGVGAVGFGWLRAAGGIGAALVTLALAHRPITRHVGPVLLAVVAAFGVFTVVLGLTRHFAVAFVAMAALTGFDAVSVFIRSTLVPLVVTADTRGRVLAVENVFIGASNELGAFESGVAGELLGTSAAVVLGGVATLAVAAGWWLLFPALRNTDRFPASVHAASPAPARTGSSEPA
jgi:MFS family permease